MASAATTHPTPEDLAVVSPPGRRRWWWLAGLGVLAAVGVTGWVASVEEPTPWETERVTVGPLVTTVTAVGNLEPLATVEVGSELSGKVLAVLVTENARVRAGDVLATLDPEPFEAAAAQARASVASADASLRRARATASAAAETADRTRRLEASGLSSGDDLRSAALAAEQGRADVGVAVAQLEQARANLRNAEKDLADTRVLAPIDGVVLHRYVEPGQTVVSAMSATALFELASDLTRLAFEAGVDEADIGRVGAGQRATFTVAAWPDRTFEATVSDVDVAPDPDASVVTYDATLVVDNADGALRPGMTATADIVVDELLHVVQVPALALRYAPRTDGPSTAAESGDAVYVLEGDTSRRQPVKVLGTNGSRTAVEGVQEGQSVVLGGGR